MLKPRNFFAAALAILIVICLATYAAFLSAPVAAIEINNLEITPAIHGDGCSTSSQYLYYSISHDGPYNIAVATDRPSTFSYGLQLFNHDSPTNTVSGLAGGEFPLERCTQIRFRVQPGDEILVNSLRGTPVIDYLDENLHSKTLYLFIKPDG